MGEITYTQADYEAFLRRQESWEPERREAWDEDVRRKALYYGNLDTQGVLDPTRG